VSIITKNISIISLSPSLCENTMNPTIHHHGTPSSSTNRRMLSNLNLSATKKNLNQLTPRWRNAHALLRNRRENNNNQLRNSIPPQDDENWENISPPPISRNDNDKMHDRKMKRRPMIPAPMSLSRVRGTRNLYVEEDNISIQSSRSNISNRTNGSASAFFKRSGAKLLQWKKYNKNKAAVATGRAPPSHNGFFKQSASTSPTASVSTSSSTSPVVSTSVRSSSSPSVLTSASTNSSSDNSDGNGPIHPPTLLPSFDEFYKGLRLELSKDHSEVCYKTIKF